MIVRTEAADQNLVDRLEAVGVTIISPQRARTMGHHVIRLGLLNRMPDPAFQATEEQVFGAVGSHEISVEPVLVKLNNDPQARKGRSRAKNLARYHALAEVQEFGLDGLFVTGDNLEIRAHAGFASQTEVDLEALPPEEVDYYNGLLEVVRWSKSPSGALSTYWSCLSAHMDIAARFGVPKEIAEREDNGKIIKQKVFGVYDHEIVATDSPLVRAMGDKIRAPHSRWGNISVEAMEAIEGLRLVAISRKVGWLLAEASNESGGLDFFSQGHLEYGRLDLHREYRRDKRDGRLRPEGYYRAHMPALAIFAQYSWASDARLQYGNWVRYIHHQARLRQSA